MPNLKPYRTKAQKAEARRTARKDADGAWRSDASFCLHVSKANGTGTKLIKCRCASRAGHGARMRRSSNANGAAPCERGAMRSLAHSKNGTSIFVRAIYAGYCSGNCSIMSCSSLRALYRK